MHVSAESAALGLVDRAGWAGWNATGPCPDCADPALDPGGNDLHVDADAVCPRCLTWVRPGQYVRRTAYGPVQHEVCPRAALTRTGG